MTPERFFEIARTTTWRTVKSGAVRNAPKDNFEFCPTSYVQLYEGFGTHLAFTAVTVSERLGLDVEFVRRVQAAADGPADVPARAWLIEQLGDSFDRSASWYCPTK